VAQDPLQFDICVEIGIQSENQVQCLPIAYSVTSFNGREGFSSAEKKIQKQYKTRHVITRINGNIKEGKEKGF